MDVKISENEKTPFNGVRFSEVEQKKQSKLKPLSTTNTTSGNLSTSAESFPQCEENVDDTATQAYD